MSRRIEVELTSRREDGSWTWRAAGAREPRGLVEGSLLPAESKVGDVLRVEIETFIDGIGILAVLPPKAHRAEPQRLELLGPRRAERLVTTTLAPRGRGDRDRPRRREGRDGDDGGRREGREGGRPREGAERRSRPPMERRPPLEPKPKPKRLRPGRTHRRELIAGLPEEQRPIAEELSRGGIPGVRAALESQNAQAKAEGKPEINPGPLLSLAEELWPRMRSAEWRDRAEAAIKEVDELDLRDLRSVVVAADSAARDDESRALAAQLRDALTRRVDEEHLKWLTELAELVADNRVVAALRRSSRPPKAAAPLPSDLARLLIDRTSEALNADVTADRWAVLLDALSFSPVRSSVTPASIPEHANEELLTAVRKSAARLPHIAALFGIEAPPVPAAPARGGRRGGGGRTGARAERAGGPAGGRRGGPEHAETEAAAQTAGPEPAAQTAGAEPAASAGTPAPASPPVESTSAEASAAEPSSPQPTSVEASAAEPSSPEPASADTTAAEPAPPEAPATQPAAESTIAQPPAEPTATDATGAEPAASGSTGDAPSSPAAAADLDTPAEPPAAPADGTATAATAAAPEAAAQENGTAGGAAADAERPADETGRDNGSAPTGTTEHGEA